MKTYPSDWKDHLLWPTLRLSWTPLTGGKVSYWWHWQIWHYPRRFQIAVPEFELDRTAKERTGRWSSFWQTNFGWKKLVTFQPLYQDDYKLLTNGYRIGFQAGQLTMICSIILHGPADALLGPGPVSFFGVAYPDNREFPLMLSGYSRRQTRNHKNIFI